jgi:hypothetical protein
MILFFDTVYFTVSAVIANKGFRGMRRFVARFNFRCTLIGDSPATPYWPYRQTLAFIVKRQNRRQNEKRIFAA